MTEPVDLLLLFRFFDGMGNLYIAKLALDFVALKSLPGFQILFKALKCFVGLFEKLIVSSQC